MAPASADPALVAATARALDARHEAKAERARAMDMIVELLLERAESRELLATAAQHIWHQCPEGLQCPTAGAIVAFMHATKSTA